MVLHNIIFFIEKDEFHVIYDKFVTFVKIFYQTDFNLKVLIKLIKIIRKMLVGTRYSTQEM